MLEIENLVAGYGKVPIIGPISLRVNHGEVIVLWGPNGTGKTTLLRTIASLLKPLEGSIILDGKPISKVKKKIFLLDERVHLPGSLKAIEYLKLIGALYESDQIPYQEILKHIGIPPNILIFNLSQGQKRRLQLASTLTAETAELFLIDDPTVGLDDISVKVLIPWIIKQLADMEKIILISTRTEFLKELLKDARVIDVTKYSRALPKT
ncbi:hypothetical protein A3L04_05315 [Thermococcus chitonophagus]|uniref:Branched-chain amino acid transport ATP-binding protein LivF (TC 3.A.1.4.1) n=1 Tax=Thermococcus chitonophagus TaxID=54262 RepID=A0A160VRV4_9EURY|nr:ATP-binding cassette domain-containing protein [Thermococcus chitonophagus]ASJ16534.1 hypothetical protein A3L04_05315 [Thermococcus chitonophagus]CUX77562.1 Branched-chain amino acid transport ATP-binding protein LivF (TC 3.A.1.4.1) [Thermococcus chitonophagus]